MRPGTERPLPIRLSSSSVGTLRATTPGTRSVPARGAELRIDGVTVVGRDGARPESLSAVVAPGSITVLTGPNGAGKSTALQVILGITEPTSRTRHDRRHRRGRSRPRSRGGGRSPGSPSDRSLVPGTVKDNLDLFGELDDHESACRDARFDCVLDLLPNGIHTVLGRGGSGLSLGQRQRLGLARALGSPASVLLLDEPTAHLDSATESTVLTAIARRARSGDTVIVVTHRDRVLAIGDQVIDMGRDRALA